MSSCEDGFIPSALYNQIADSVPIVSVEALIVMDDLLLFLKRNNHPAKGQWWFPGGRIRKGESLKEACVREVKEETNLEVNSLILIGVYSRVFPERHDITIAYLCKCKKGKITINNEHSEYSLSKTMPKGLHYFLLETVKDSMWEKQLST